jgi:predicted ATPase
MLESLSLTNFRAFKALNIRFAKLNVFVGPNNSGKSSIISAINLIAQNAKQGRREGSLALNGAYADLGTYYDVIYEHKANSNMKIEFQIDRFRYEYNFRYRIQRREIQLYKSIISDGVNAYHYTLGKDSATHSVILKNVGRPIALSKSKPRVFGLNFYVPFGAIMELERDNPDRDVSSALRRLFISGVNGLEEHFFRFDSIGSFRAPPQRTYLYSGESPEEVGRAGENSAQIMAASSSSRDKAAQEMIRRVGSWFKAADIAHGVAIRSLTNRHFELSVEDRLGFSSNIVDVGFGCSQVLPVVIGGYKLAMQLPQRETGTYVVQEPEIHLHPNAAAHLGTFFCDLSRRNIQCFVETHSENLILRIARHVALGQIAPEDVRIFWVGDSSGERTVTRLEFKNEWPGGFFPTRSTETLELARAAAHIPSNSQLELTFDG